MPTIDTPGIARDGDLCGGPITATATKMLVDGLPVVRVGDQVEDHGDSPHNNAVMVEGSSRLIVEGQLVCRIGDAASCGHKVTVGSTRAFAGPPVAV